jgi:hypothetical protein
VMRGGRWDGVIVVSKSGAFGHPTLLRELLPIAETNTLTDGNAPAIGTVRRAS